LEDIVLGFYLEKCLFFSQIISKDDILPSTFPPCVYLTSFHKLDITGSSPALAENVYAAHVNG
jgi:hypothetical protein